MTCFTPAIPRGLRVTGVWFELDNVKVEFASIVGKPFKYHPDPVLRRLNHDTPEQLYHFKPGGVIAVEVSSACACRLVPAAHRVLLVSGHGCNPQGEGLTLAMTREEVVAWVGLGKCDVKTLDSTHLYCEPPENQPGSLDSSDGSPSLRVSAVVH